MFTSQQSYINQYAVNREYSSVEKVKGFILGMVLFSSIASILYLLLYLIFDFNSPVLFAAMLAIFWVFNSAAGSSFYLRYLGAREFDKIQNPELYRITSEILKNARESSGLNTRLRLFYIPSGEPNAFTLSLGKNDHNEKSHAIVLTGGLISRLNEREIAGVLAHEIAHIANHDLQTLQISYKLLMFNRLLSFAGRFLAPFLFLGLLISGSLTLSSLGGLALLYLAAPAGMLLYLALSRTREYMADLSAIEYTNDPQGFISALRKIDAARRPGPFFFWYGKWEGAAKRNKSPVWQTHPNMEDRINRLEKAMRLLRIKRTPVYLNVF